MSSLLLLGVTGWMLSQDCTFRPPVIARPQHVTKARGIARRRTAVDRPAARNFVDGFIFSKLDRDGVPAAALSSDAQFLRRIFLDLTGRLPSPAQIRDFLASEAPDKRAQWIDRLLDSPEYADKWTMWAGDWLQLNAEGIYVDPVSTRNQFHLWLRDAIRDNRSLRDVALDVLTGMEASSTAQTGGFLAATEVNTGPKEDSWDNMLAKSAAQFLGLGHYDCLLCHSGKGHLDPISLWGSRTSRLEAQRMAAFFTNTFSYPGIEENEATALQYYRTPGYSMDTYFGNRPNRVAAPEGLILTAAYRDGSKPNGDMPAWRGFFASKLAGDPMFARNLANRLWKQMFGTGLVEPVDALDPDRLDPAHPPPAPWALQASHPELLEALAQFLQDSNYDLKAFVRLVANSGAWQLSSEWPEENGEWRAEWYFQYARRAPRRLAAEEVHDAIQTATGIEASYAIAGRSETVHWAMQLPDTAEPVLDPPSKGFLDAFYRGKRLPGADRGASSSLLQAFKLLNDPLALRRIDVASSPVLQRLLAIESPDETVREAFLTFLSREPFPAEIREARAAIAGDKIRGLEDLAWVLLNHTDFLFSF